MNQVFLIGNVCKDLELTQTPSGVSITKFSIAVSRDYTNADGEKEVDFFNIVVWRGLAENCCKFLKKGSKVAVVGSLQNNNYKDKDGVRKTSTQIIAKKIEFLTPKEKNEEVQKSRTPLEGIDDNQLPF